MTPDQSAYLATLPLHAITSSYGEEGLRNRFALEIAQFLDAEQERLDRALVLATELHAGDRRQREPYVNHLLRVAIRIVSHYGVDDPDVICAALLHDSVEDHAAELTPEGSRDAALTILAARFGPRVAELVAAVTNPEDTGGQDKNRAYREHVTASLTASPWARIIKVSDFTDNGVGLIHTTGAKLTRLAAKYAPLIPILRELIARPDTPLSQQARALIDRQLEQAQRRLAALLPEDYSAGLVSQS
jgi:hypothetical protein